MAITDDTWFLDTPDLFVQSVAQEFPDDFTTTEVRALVLDGPTITANGQALSVAQQQSLLLARGLTVTSSQLAAATTTIRNRQIFERTLGATRNFYILAQFLGEPFSQGATIPTTVSPGSVTPASVASVTGPQGIQGLVGSIGLTGPAGATGPAGPPVNLGTIAPPVIAATSQLGGSTSAAREDHTHGHGVQLGGTLHAVATIVLAGFMSVGDKQKLDGIEPAATADQIITAGAGLTGGGSGDVTLDVIANPDGSIVVNANDLQVGILATDAQHGNRGGGGIHTLVAPAGAAGFMSGADKTKLDGIEAGATAEQTLAEVLTTGAATGGTVISDTLNLAADLMMAGIHAIGGSTAGPATANLRVLSTNGVMLLHSTDADAATKESIYGSPARNNAEIPLGLITGSAQAGFNIVRLGGGLANAQAANRLSLYTAASSNTPTGTEQIRVDSDGDMIAIGNGDLGDAGANAWGTLFAANAQLSALLDVVGDVTLESDLILDGATGNGDLTMAGDLAVTGSGTFDTTLVGDPAGTTISFKLKLDAGQYSEHYNVDSTGGADRRWIHSFTSNEDLFWSRRSVAGAAVDTPLQLYFSDGRIVIANNLILDGAGAGGAGDLTMAGDLDVTGTGQIDGTLTVSTDFVMDESTPIMTMGIGTGAVNLRMNKGDSNANTIQMQNLGVLRFNIQMASNEDMLFETFNAAGASTGFTVLRNATHNWELGAALDVVGDATLESDLILDGATGNGDVAMVGELSVGTLSAPPSQVQAFIVGTNGGLQLADVETNATNKFAKLTMSHFTSDTEQPVSLIGGIATNTTSTVYIGGQNVLFNAATQVSVFTAPDNTTVGGTEQIRIDSAGDLLAISGSNLGSDSFRFATMFGIALDLTGNISMSASGATINLGDGGGTTESVELRLNAPAVGQTGDSFIFFDRDSVRQYAIIAQSSGSLDIQYHQTDGTFIGNAMRFAPGAGNVGSIVIAPATTTLLGFHGAAPVALAAVYTQTFSATTRTHANFTSVTVTDGGGGTAAAATVAVPSVNGSGATTAQETAIDDNFASVIRELNRLRVDVTNVKELVNQILDDFQLKGLLQ